MTCDDGLCIFFPTTPIVEECKIVTEDNNLKVRKGAEFDRITGKWRARKDKVIWGAADLRKQVIIKI